MEQKASVFRVCIIISGILELNEQLRQAVRSFPGAQEGDPTFWSPRLYRPQRRPRSLECWPPATWTGSVRLFSIFRTTAACFSAFPLSANAAFAVGTGREGAARTLRASAGEAARLRRRPKLERCAICVFWTAPAPRFPGRCSGVSDRRWRAARRLLAAPAGAPGDFVLGSLLNEPDQNFICHKGDVLLFRLPARPQDALVCPVDLDGSFS